MHEHNMSASDALLAALKEITEPPKVLKQEKKVIINPQLITLLNFFKSTYPQSPYAQLNEEEQQQLLVGANMLMHEQKMSASDALPAALIGLKQQKKVIINPQLIKVLNYFKSSYPQSPYAQLNEEEQQQLLVGANMLMHEQNMSANDALSAALIGLKAPIPKPSPFNMNKPTKKVKIRRMAGVYHVNQLLEEQQKLLQLKDDLKRAQEAHDSPQPQYPENLRIEEENLLQKEKAYKSITTDIALAEQELEQIKLDVLAKKTLYRTQSEKVREIKNLQINAQELKEEYEKLLTKVNRIKNIAHNKIEKHKEELQRTIIQLERECNLLKQNIDEIEKQEQIELEERNKLEIYPKVVYATSGSVSF